MSSELVGRAKKTKVGGDSTAKLLLICLADYANDEGMAWPSVKTMTREVEKSERVVQRALRKLELMGLIRRGDQRRAMGYPVGQRPTVYEILPRRRATGDAKDTGVEYDTPQTGDVEDIGGTHDTGDAYDTPPVTSTTPHRCRTRRGRGDAHDTQTVIEPILRIGKPSRESTRAKNRKPDHDERRQALADWTPNESHRTLAGRYGLDPAFEADKFRATTTANGSIPADIDAAFTLWLHRGRELGISSPASTGTKPHRHTWKCDHVTGILARFGMTPDDSYELAQGIAAKLRDGMDEQAIADELAEVQQQESYWEAA